MLHCGHEPSTLQDAFYKFRLDVARLPLVYDDQLGFVCDHSSRKFPLPGQRSDVATRNDPVEYVRPTCLSRVLGANDNEFLNLVRHAKWKQALVELVKKVGTDVVIREGVVYAFTEILWLRSSRMEQTLSATVCHALILGWDMERIFEILLKSNSRWTLLSGHNQILSG